MRSRKVSPGFDRHLDANPVRQHLRAAGDRGAIAARLANHRRRFAGNRALVHRRDAFDDVAVGRNHLAGLDPDDIALAQRRRRHGLERAVGALAFGHRFGLGAPQRIGLRLASSLGHRFREVGEQHRQPEPERDLQLEAKVAAAGDDVLHQTQRRQHAADQHDEHDRVARHRPRVELAERVPHRALDDLRIPE